MPRRKSCSIEENEALAKAWVTISQDPIVGNDQNRKIFRETVPRIFIETAPHPPAKIDSIHCRPTLSSITQRFSDISAEVHKFRFTLKLIRSSADRTNRRSEHQNGGWNSL